MLFRIIGKTEEQYLKENPYAAKEYQVELMNAPNESVANARVRRGIIEGIYPHGSYPQEVENG